MIVRYIGNYYKIRLKKSAMYDVLSVENGWYELTDELGENGFYPPEQFEIVK